MKPNKPLVVATLIVLTACGAGNGGSNNKATVERQEIAEATPGTYYAILRPVNFHSNGFIPYGQASFILKGDQLQVSTSMDDDQAVTHRQSLHIGSRCPNPSDDMNGDGFIDYNEALAVVGKAVMPLDDDLNSQSAGAGTYPRGSGMTYSKSASLKSINTDLLRPDENPSDDIMKLPSGRGIGFHGSILLVHGTAPQSFFPSSVASRAGEQVNISLPVVCGVLSKIE